MSGAPTLGLGALIFGTSTMHRQNYTQNHQQTVHKLVSQYEAALARNRVSQIAAANAGPGKPNLMEHQRQGVIRLKNEFHQFIAFEPGLGKTRTCIAALDALNIRSGILVICPAIARQNWANEFKKWGVIDRTAQVCRPSDRIMPNIGVRIMSYDAISTISEADRNHMLQAGIKVLILDEAHRLKEPGAKRTKIIYGAHASMRKALAAQARHVWLLSGTPAPNHVGELWTHLRALAPELIQKRDGNPMTRYEFEELFCEMKHTQFGRQIIGSRFVPQLRKKIEPFFFPKREKDCLDLPDLRFDIQEVDITNLSDADTDMLALVERNLETVFTNVYAKSPGAAPNISEAMREAAPHVATERRMLGLVKAPLVAQYVDNYLQNAPKDRKVIVFAYHTDVIDVLMEHTGEYLPLRIDGRDNDGTRNVNIGLFQHDPKHRVLIAQINAAGEAITLTAANRIIFAEPSWTPKDNLQAAKRAHRIGQTSKVYASYMTLPRSLDRSIMTALLRKTKDLEPLMV